MDCKNIKKKKKKKNWKLIKMVRDSSLVWHPPSIWSWDLKLIIYTQETVQCFTKKTKMDGECVLIKHPYDTKWPKTRDGKRCAADMCWNGPGGSEWTPQVSLETHTWPELCANTPKLAENGTKNSPKSAKMAQKWPQIDTNVRRTPEIDFEQGGWQAC